jgi:hypothetical protein
MFLKRQFENVLVVELAHFHVCNALGNCAFVEPKVQLGQHFSNAKNVFA